MRTIKFRAWVNEHWVDWLPNSKTLGEYNEVGIYADEYCTDGKCFIEQYTGFRDKNGKEIYEGDIVKARYDYMNGSYEESTEKVEWDEDEGGFYIGWFHLSDYEYLEVIGNIHENPELLNSVKEEEKQEKNKIVRNSFHCKKCGMDVESKSVHHFAECECRNFTDGGKEYIRRGGNFEDMEDTSIYE